MQNKAVILGFTVALAVIILTQTLPTSPKQVKAPKPLPAKTAKTAKPKPPDRKPSKRETALRKAQAFEKEYDKAYLPKIKTYDSNNVAIANYILERLDPNRKAVYKGTVDIKPFTDFLDRLPEIERSKKDIDSLWTCDQPDYYKFKRKSISIGQLFERNHYIYSHYREMLKAYPETFKSFKELYNYEFKGFDKWPSDMIVESHKQLYKPKEILYFENWKDFKKRIANVSPEYLTSCWKNLFAEKLKTGDFKERADLFVFNHFLWYHISDKNREYFKLEGSIITEGQYRLLTHHNRATGIKEYKRTTEPKVYITFDSKDQEAVHKKRKVAESVNWVDTRRNLAGMLSVYEGDHYPSLYFVLTNDYMQDCFDKATIKDSFKRAYKDKGEQLYKEYLKLPKPMQDLTKEIDSIVKKYDEKLFKLYDFRN